jgi:hypothetical protein
VAERLLPRAQVVVGALAAVAAPVLSGPLHQHLVELLRVVAAATLPKALGDGAVASPADLHEAARVDVWAEVVKDDAPRRNLAVHVVAVDAARRQRLFHISSRPGVEVKEAKVEGVVHRHKLVRGRVAEAVSERGVRAL